MAEETTSKDVANDTGTINKSNRNPQIIIASAVAVVLIIIVLIVLVVINSANNEGIDSEQTTDDEQSQNLEDNNNDADDQLVETQPIEIANLLYISDDKIFAREVESGETNEIRDLTGCPTNRLTRDNYYLGDISAYASDSGSFYVACGQSIIVVSEVNGFVEYDLSDLIDSSDAITEAELSRDGSLLAVKTSVNRNTFDDDKLFIYDTNENTVVELSGSYSYSSDNEVGITLSHFSPDNSFFYATNAAPAGYLADAVLAYNLETNQRTQLRGIDISDDQQFSSTIFAGTDNNVAEDGTMYFWSANDVETLISTLSLDGDEIAKNERKTYATDSNAITLADYNTAFSQLVDDSIILNNYVRVCEVANASVCGDETASSFTILDIESESVEYFRGGFDQDVAREVFDYVDGKIYYTTRTFTGQQGGDQVKLFELDTESDQIKEILDLGTEGVFLGHVSY